MYDPGASGFSVNGMPFAAVHADVRSRPAPLTVRFTDDSTGTQSRFWSWDFGDGQTSADRDPVHEYVSVPTR